MNANENVSKWLAVFYLCVVLCGCDNDTLAPLSPSLFKAPPVTSSSIYPLHVDVKSRYLLDVNNHPFLINGDAAWSLIAELNKAEVISYLNDRKKRGFNAILVNLLEHKFSRDAPANIYGISPFEKKNRFDTPNNAYFTYVDWVIQQAAKRGLLVLLTPAYLGYNGGDEGWYKIMQENGEKRLRYYGRYLGLRYRNYHNILWVEGGDYNPPNRNLVREIALGIKEYDSRALHTAHCSRGTAALSYWHNESWLDVNSIYITKSAFPAAKEQYLNSGMPFFLIEGDYEGEKVHAHGARVQAYQALLSGAAGQVFGNNPIWHFDGPGVFKSSVPWEQSLASNGSKSMTQLWRLFNSHQWWKLTPDLSNRLLIDGIGTNASRSVAAIASDHSFALIYIPSPRTITVDLSKLQGRRLKANWFDPTNGQYLPVSTTLMFSNKAQKFSPIGANHAGKGDWVLVLEASQRISGNKKRH